MSATIDTWTGRLGLIGGILVVAAWLAVAGRPAAGPDVPPATVRVTTLGSGELLVEPLAKPIVGTTRLRAGDKPRGGSVTVENMTPRGLAFALRADTARKDLDASTWIEVSAGGDNLLRTTLGRARAWSGARLALAAGEKSRLAVRVWIPKDAPNGWQAARGDVMLEFSSKKGAGR